jgi:hypothetical protein
MSPTDLDSLYGKGASSAFIEATGASTTGAYIEGGVRVYCDWPDGSTMKIDCWPDRVHYLSLTSEREGLYTDLCDTLPELFKGWGVKTFTASAGNDEADAILRKRGEWQDAERGIRWEL